MEKSEYLTVREVADIVKVWPETVRSWLHEGKLKGSKLPGGEWRIKGSDLEEMFHIPPSLKGFYAPKDKNSEALNAIECRV